MADQVDSAGELALELSGDGVTATVQTFPNTAVDSADTGTNPPVRTLEQTQGTPSDDQGSGIFAFQNAGVGAGRDDSVPASSTTNQIILGTDLNAPITPRPNVLDQYSSYTYSISWYLLTPQQSKEIFETHKCNVNSWQLLMQSGGAPAAVGPGGRNKYFTLDYYMDNLVMEMLLPGKGTGASQNAVEFTFTVTEPNGLTLIQNLAKAVNDLSQAGTNTNGSTAKNTGNFQQAQYCLAIRFYGYDADGNLVYPITGNTTGMQTPTMGDPAAVIQRFYPFNLKDITFRLVNKTVEYTVTGLPQVYNQASGSDRATIPYAFALVGKTLDDVLNGKPITTNANDSGNGRPTTNTVATPPQNPPQASYNSDGTVNAMDANAYGEG